MSSLLILLLTFYAMYAKLNLRNKKDVNSMKFSVSAQTAEEISDYISRSLKDACLKKELTNSLEISCDEILSNILKHSNASEISVDVCVSKKNVSLRFEDNGTPFDPTKFPEPDISSHMHSRTPGGLGLLIVRKHTDEIFYEYSNMLNKLTLVKKI